MGNSFVLPATKSDPETQYKKCKRREADEYNLLLRQYNAPFEHLVRWTGATLEPVQQGQAIASLVYNPPRPPPWVASAFDVSFERDIATYNLQLQKFNVNRADPRMERVYNTPPVPAPPAESLLEADDAAAQVRGGVANPPAPATDGEPASIEDAIRKANETDPNRIAYIRMYFAGKQYKLYGQNYDDWVYYNPPKAGEQVYDNLLRSFMVLYEQIRALHALNTGSEVFSMPFTVPQRPGSAAVAEGFADPTTCVDINTAQQNWYLSQVIDTEGRRNLQQEFCRNAGLTYDPLQCGIRRCVQRVTDMTSEAGAAEAAKYNYNQSSFSASNYPRPPDNTRYRQQLGQTIQISDISGYFTQLNKYNFYWLNQNGWREATQAAEEKPYNPPIAPWITEANPATAGDQQFLSAVAAFNTRAKDLIQRFNNYEAVQLPAAFGSLPAPPPYPNLLYEMLMRPQQFVRPQNAGDIPVQQPSGPQITYRLPVAEAGRIYSEVAQAPPPPPPPAPERPACNDLSGGCVVYDDEVNDVAKRLLEEMRAKRMNSAGISYAMSRPRIPEAAVNDRLGNYYNRIMNDIRESIPAILQSSNCN